MKGAHGFGIHADTLLHEIDPMKADLLFLPGGMPGTKNLMACKPLCDDWCSQMLLESPALAAICALRAFWGSWGF
ncbi:MAG: DJ-1/PfpI family protein [Clostridium fessum]